MRIYMEVECMQQIVSRLERVLDISSQYAGRIESALYDLETYWQGPAPQEYISGQQAELLAAWRHIRTLNWIVERIEREIREFLRVSSGFDG